MFKGAEMLTEVKLPMDIPTSPHYAILRFTEHWTDMPCIRHWVTKGVTPADVNDINTKIGEMLRTSTGKNILILEVSSATIPIVEIVATWGEFTLPVSDQEFVPLKEAKALTDFPLANYESILIFKNYAEGFPYTQHLIASSNDDVDAALQNLYDHYPSRADIARMSVKSVSTVKKTVKIHLP